ncbi:MAG: NAD-dependent epimerase/dehydratase family protein [Candidatus Limnocylindrales bacterium]
MRILVTGAAGFIGSHVAEQLLSDGREVVLLDAFTDYYDRASKERNVATSRQHPNATFHELDLRTDDLAPAFEQVDRVIHLAAMPGLPRSWTDMGAYTSCNLIATSRLVEAAQRAGITRYVQISTSSVYGEDAMGDEGMPVRPVSPYGVTKLAAEHLVGAYVQTHGFPATILRYFSIYGPRQRPDMAYHKFIEALLDGQPLTVFGDGRQSRSSTYIADCVAATIRALDAAAVGEVYNIGGGERVELLDVIGIIAAELGVTADIRFAASRAGDQRHTGADTSKAREAFGYQPTWSARDGLAAQIAWHRSLRTGSR